ncbi:O-antigen ligase family protein [Paucilactobacillus hokkaidonensis]|uniref:O-antigen ligase-related domain-containing protein n=2 Tax=Paucilactobacillus hokkaidonensis TaxID=1193095 RepID=A0ABR5Q799_9LACO|nr:O-antigen ligase family protein [Paucilactobacillus hokkaidonensis]KRO09343.1 hypothetical protein IV59_GL000681 [Paucilactobacillus hokkaidonensis]
MENSISLTKTNRLPSLQFVLVIITGIGLIQSTVLGGLNFSLADISLVLLALLMLSNADAKLPVVELTFLAVVFLSRTIISLILPSWLSIINPEVFASVLKFGLIIIYFVAGYLIGSRTRAIKLLLKMFVIANLIIGLVGIITICTNTISIVPGLFTSFRYKGLMNDPNYFSMLQIMCLPFIHLFWPHRPVVRGVITLCLVVAAILSGSKSALLVLCLLGIFKLVTGTWKLLKSGRIPQLTIIVLTILILITIGTLITPQLANVVHTLEAVNPSFARISTLFSGDNPLTSNGSDRTSAWKNALSITATMNGLGIGFHDYGIVANQLVGETVIAHNTILQLVVEWGISFTFIFICFMGYQFWRGWRSAQPLVRALTSAMAICIIYSMSISLNNSRIFWIFLAIWFAQIAATKSTTRRMKNENFSNHGNS